MLLAVQPAYLLKGLFGEYVKGDLKETLKNKLMSTIEFCKENQIDVIGVYKNFNALWAGKGYFGDGNWAYVQGKKMERRRMISELFNKSVKPLKKLTNLWHILTNVISDLFFGYGESMFKMIVTYILTVFFFAWVFTENVSILEYTQALAISLKNMAGMDSETIRGVSPLVDMLNVIQTTIGILLTGIFGFILGNKIRNQ